MEHILGFETLLFEVSSYPNSFYLVMERSVFEQIQIFIGETQLKHGYPYIDEDSYVDESKIEFCIPFENLKKAPLVFHLFENENDTEHKIRINSDERENITISGWYSGATQIISFNGYYRETGKWIAPTVKCFINFQTQNYIFVV